jgi:WXG100 family type VII secretion target
MQPAPPYGPGTGYGTDPTAHTWSNGGAGGSRIAVPSELQAAGSTINGIAAAIEGELSALKSLLAPLQDTWTGAAQSYYQGLQNEWNIAADGLFGPTGVLGQIAQTMNLNWNNYTDTESANVKTWQH